MYEVKTADVFNEGQRSNGILINYFVCRYVSLLSEHRRVILCGPSGTGKSYLAAKLAEFYVQRTQRRGNPVEAVATFKYVFLFSVCFSCSI